jgi:deoxyribose-phosphate aldolase
MESRDLDRLVDVIAARVQERLATPRTSGGAGCHSAECASCRLPGEACGSCGLNPLSNAMAAFQPPASDPSPREMARFIDHTLLRPDTDRESLEKLCREAREHEFFSVCVNAGNVNLAARLLAGSVVKVCAVVGFPLGAGTPGAKAYEAREAVRCGASEIDMVINIGALRSHDYALVLDDIQKVVRAVPGKLVKVILETGMLGPEEKAIGCALSKAAGAHFVKTSTGFGPGGATVEDIALMRTLVGKDVGVKASGGVRDYAGAVAMLRAGANRIGASSSVAIVTGGRGSSGY